MEQGALTVLDACLREHADDEDLYNMAVAAFLRIADCGQSPPLPPPPTLQSHSSCMLYNSPHSPVPLQLLVIQQSPLSSPTPAASDTTVLCGGSGDDAGVAVQ